MSVEPTTGSDCEVIIHLYLKYGIEQTLQMLDGVYAFILYDNRINDDLQNKVYVARDPLGVRPLYYLKKPYQIEENKQFGFASELKCLVKFYNMNPNVYSIEQFKPGTYSVFNHSNKVDSIWEAEKENAVYFIPSFSHTWRMHDDMKDNYDDNIYSYCLSIIWWS